ncbi:hypothetical protein BCT69_18875 [Enterovibrio norvegicus]|nr:hypothetical protein BCT69_18875 [Enterovibrio norvegicus]
MRQNGGFLHTSRLALGNLWKTLDVRVSGFAFANKERGKIALAVNTSFSFPQCHDFSHFRAGSPAAKEAQI